MTTFAKVNLWGKTIGAVSIEDDDAVASFQYDEYFVESGIKVSPILMPPSIQTYRFPNLKGAPFLGLPGMLADALPDKFGNAIINAWLARQGRPNDELNPVERLCYIGSRGMGALEFKPTMGPTPVKGTQLQVDKLVELSSRILTHREQLTADLSEIDDEKALLDILRVGSSAGGARAKAIIAWSPKTNRVRSGQIHPGDGYEHWLMKFDGVKGNKDRELDDPKGYGVIEYAYSKMVKAAGIRMSECRLFEENDRRHFMTKRFDRKPNGKKLHMQSLGALLHLDFNMTGAHSYEQAFVVIKQLGLGMDTVEEMYRRMAFNILARNQDDHVKNISFLMDKNGDWSLAPAFDMTYSFNPNGVHTSKHQMTMNGKQDNFTTDDFKLCARSASMKQGVYKTILNDVHAAVSKWRDFADEEGIEESKRDKIQKALRLHLKV